MRMEAQSARFEAGQVYLPKQAPLARYTPARTFRVSKGAA
jgi:hypothetical protein